MPTINATSNTEITKQFYAALNRNDVSAVLELCAPDIVRIEFEGLPSGGTYRGLAEFRAHVSKGRDTWAEGTCEPEQLMVLDDKVVALVFVSVRLKNKTEWLEGRTADVFRFRAGKVIEFRTFMEKEQAFAWAGVPKA